MKKLLLLALLVAGSTVFAEDIVKKHHFLKQQDGSYLYNSNAWNVMMQPGKGWTSLLVNGSQFFDQRSPYGAALYKNGKDWITNFPAESLISNSGPTKGPGCLLSIGNGIFLLRLIPHPMSQEIELYSGANQKEDYELVLFFNDDIAMMRIGEDFPGERAKLSVINDKMRKVRSAIIVHKNGPSLMIESPCQAGKMNDPAGKMRWAIVLPCKGFIANTFRISIEPKGSTSNWVSNPSFKVSSSDDPAKRDQVATKGVMRPVYTPKTKLDFNIAFKWLKKIPFNGVAELDIVHSLGNKHFYQEKRLQSVTPDKKGMITVNFKPEFSLPGVSEVWGRLYDENGELIWVDRYRMLYDLDHFKPNIVVQDDHKEFWDKTLEELKKVPLDPTITRVEKYKDHPVNEIYELTFNTLGNKRIHAMLFVPKERSGPLPAVVTSHPGITGFRINKGPDGVYGSKEFKKNSGFVTITPLIRGYKPDDPDIPFNKQWWGDLESRDNYCAREWYCSMIKAIDYLETRPDIVDMKRVITTGGSQGGALALVTAALDPRIKYCFAMCPAACQFHEMIDSYWTFGPGKGQVPKGQTVDDLKKTLSYYDAVNFCPWIKCPTYIGINVGDTTVHSMGGLAAFKNLKSLDDKNKDIFIGNTYYHGSSPDFNIKKDEIMKELREK